MSNFGQEISVRKWKIHRASQESNADRAQLSYGLQHSRIFVEILAKYQRRWKTGYFKKMLTSYTCLERNSGGRHRTVTRNASTEETSSLCLRLLSSLSEPFSPRYERRTERRREFSRRLSRLRDSLSGVIPFSAHFSNISSSTASPLPFQSVTLLFRSASTAPMTTTLTRRGQIQTRHTLRLVRVPLRGHPFSRRPCSSGGERANASSLSNVGGRATREVMATHNFLFSVCVVFIPAQRRGPASSRSVSNERNKRRGISVLVGPARLWWLASRNEATGSTGERSEHRHFLRILSRFCLRLRHLPPAVANASRSEKGERGLGGRLFRRGGDRLCFRSCFGA